jgi:hypothetical protein
MLLEQSRTVENGRESNFRPIAIGIWRYPVNTVVIE